jgi:hypothetical protein
VFRPVLESSRLPVTIPHALHDGGGGGGRCPGQFLETLLCEVFT